MRLPTLILTALYLLSACDGSIVGGDPPDTAAGRWVAEVEYHGDTTWTSGDREYRTVYDSRATVTLTLADEAGAVTGTMAVLDDGEWVQTWVDTETGERDTVRHVLDAFLATGNLRGTYAPPYLQLSEVNGSTFGIRTYEDLRVTFTDDDEGEARHAYCGGRCAPTSGDVLFRFERQ